MSGTLYNKIKVIEIGGVTMEKLYMGVAREIITPSRRPSGLRKDKGL